MITENRGNAILVLFNITESTTAHQLLTEEMHLVVFSGMLGKDGPHMWSIHYDNALKFRVGYLQGKRGELGQEHAKRSLSGPSVLMVFSILDQPLQHSTDMIHMFLLSLRKYKSIVQVHENEAIQHVRKNAIN